MVSQITPYLFFEGRCEEAIDFYKRALGAEVEIMMRYKDSPEPCPEGMLPPGGETKIMHTTLKIGATTLMLSDGRCSGAPNFQGTSLSLTCADEAEARRVFDALAAGGQIHMPLGKTFYSPCFGMVADKFGVGWMVIVWPA